MTENNQEFLKQQSALKKFNTQLIDLEKTYNETLSNPGDSSTTEIKNQIAIISEKKASCFKSLADMLVKLGEQQKDYYKRVKYYKRAEAYLNEAINISKNMVLKFECTQLHKDVTGAIKKLQIVSIKSKKNGTKLGPINPGNKFFTDIHTNSASPVSTDHNSSPINNMLEYGQAENTSPITATYAEPDYTPAITSTSNYLNDLYDEINNLKSQKNLALKKTTFNGFCTVVSVLFSVGSFIAMTLTGAIPLGLFTVVGIASAVFNGSAMIHNAAEYAKLQSNINRLNIEIADLKKSFNRFAENNKLPSVSSKLSQQKSYSSTSSFEKTSTQPPSITTKSIFSKEPYPVQSPVSNNLAKNTTPAYHFLKVF